MKVCAQCGSEYEDAVAECSDCGGQAFVPPAAKEASASLHQRDTRRFLPAGTAEDPLTSERFTAVLTAQNIPVFARARRGGTVDLITSAASQPWWEILVPEEHVARATQLLEEERARIEASAEEAARAAEDEELETETKPQA